MRHTYPVKIVETLKKTVFVEADSENDAFEMVENEWHNGGYHLDEDSFSDVEFYVGKPEKFKYYCLMRPVGPGSVPRGFVDWGELDHNVIIPSINHGAWGWVIYEEPLTSYEMSSYELAYAGEE